jgi:hypothetical protein
LSYDQIDKAVYAEIVVDATPPEAIALDLPQRAGPGEKVILKAKVKKRNDLEQAPITKVQFFLGDPLKEPGVVAVYDKPSQVWRAETLVPPDAKDKVAVTVRFNTAAGLAASETGTIVLQAGGSALENSKITGLVSWDTRPQPGRPVSLKDGKGKLVMTTDTDPKGVYLFVNVPPGTYRVIAAVPGMLSGAAPAVVTKEKGEIIKADVSLKRVP